MSKVEKKPIENASEVIEKFGGIRPMAKKMDVAVTTVQGWKKRDVIPAARYDEVLKAASAHDVDLAGLVEGAPPVNENVSPEKDSENSALQGAGAHVGKTSPAPAAPKPAAPLREKLERTEKNAIAKSTWINIILLFIAICAVLALLWPQNKENIVQEQRLTALEDDVDTLQEQQGFMGAMIPEDLDQQIDSLKEQAGAAGQAVKAAAQRAGEISNEVWGEEDSTMQERYARLQGQVNEMAANTPLEGLALKMDSWRQSPAGQAKLNSAIEQLNAVLAGLYSVSGDAADSDAVLEAALQSAREQSSVLGETFQGVPQDDLKAAALLLGLSQFRASLGRDNEAFNDDLQVLVGLVGNDNPALNEALMRLAPYSEQGVLTPEGLTTEFKAMAGDAVVASLKGEDVDVTERARARMNEMFQVEKGGELITGTPAQASVSAAEKYLEAGDIEAAVLEIETLEGPAAQAAQPWLSQARATMLAQDIKGILKDMMSAAQGGELIYNEEAGINVYKRAPFTSAPSPSTFEQP